MTKVFRNDAMFCTIKASVSTIVDESWMTCQLGEGEDGIENHGRSTAKVFSQETVVIGQRCNPRMGLRRPTLKRLKCRTHAISESTPHFFFSGAPKLSGLFMDRPSPSNMRLSHFCVRKSAPSRTRFVRPIKTPERLSALSNQKTRIGSSQTEGNR